MSEPVESSTAEGGEGGEDSSTSHRIQAHLSRDLGLVSALAIGVGTMIAAGIFTLSGLAVNNVGSAAIASFLLAALVATFTALTYCEFTSIYPQSGEGYLYARKTFSPPLAYMVGWCLLLGYTSSCGFYIASFSSYFNGFVLGTHGEEATAPAEPGPGERQDGERQDGERQDGERQDGEKQDGEKQDGEKHDGEKHDGEKHDGEKDGEQQDAKPPPDEGHGGHEAGPQGPLEMLSGLVALALLTLLNIKGTKESGSFQIVITIGKVILLCIFVVGGMKYFDPQIVTERFSTDILKIGSTAALVFITFFGFSAIAASAGEVINPTKTIPRAIFISMGVVTVLYTLVVLVVVCANLTSYTEKAMGEAAGMFLGPIGMMVIVFGALFSMISASNASILAGSRVALSMAQLGHLPKEIGAVNAQTRTPVIALLLVGAGIGAFASMLPLESLAHFADYVLLVALILVNIALILHRRKFPDLERPFRVPLVPLLPGIGILANTYLIVQNIQQGFVETAILAGAALVLGFAGFMAWKGTQAEAAALPGEPSRVALHRPAMGASEEHFRVLVPIANPANVDRLIDLAAAICKDQPEGGEIVALRVGVVPEQLPPSMQEAQIERERRILDMARTRALEHEIPMSSTVRIGHDAAKAILETSRQWHCRLIILGWKGYTSTARKILGEVTDSVVQHARAHIMLVKLVDDERPLEKVLLPSAGGEHAKFAEDFAARIAHANNGSLTLCGVVSPEDDARAKAEEERLAIAKERVTFLEQEQVSTKVIRHGSVPVGIIKEGESHDAIVVGAAQQSFSSKILFGTIPENIARHSSKTVIVIKYYNPVKALVGRVMSE